MLDQAIDFNKQVAAQDDGSRLDRWLADHLNQYSRSHLQKLITKGEVRVNDKIVTPHYRLKCRDQVTLNHELVPDSTPGNWGEISLVEENNDYLVVNKPSGILTHPAPGSTEKTLTDWLIEKYPDIAHVGEDLTRPGIVHRLDRDVSGLILVPRSNDSFSYFKKQFQSRNIAKTYLALVYGQIDEDGKIDLPIARSRSNRNRMAARSDGQGRPALTSYKIIKKYPHLTFLEVMPKTGRMHQIRVHLKAIGNSIVGDKLYAPEPSRSTNLPRIFLHAYQLRFTDINGQTKQYQSPLPNSLQSFLAKLDEKSSSE
ncbi:MAG: RluA family pseudouridine synthase [bacterium]